MLPRGCAKCEEELKLTEAELLTLQGRSQDVVALVCANSVGLVSEIELSIKRNMFCGLAHSTLGELDLSDKELGSAETTAETTNSPLLADVLQARGSVAAHRGLYKDAERLFNQSLQITRRQGDKELEAAGLLNLGWLDLQSERYDEAIDLFRSSSTIARTIDAQALLETDLGNTGWAELKLGDFELALTNFLQAEQQSRKLGAVLAQVSWLKNAGLCRQQLGDLAGASNDYESALHDAEAIGNKKLIADIHILIAQLLLQQGRLDVAESQADLALASARVSGDKSTELDSRFLQGTVSVRQGHLGEAENLLTKLYSEAKNAPSLRWNIENELASLAARKNDQRLADTWYRRSLATFEAQRSAVKDEEQRLPFFANGDQLYRDYAEFLLNAHKSDEALQVLDLGRAKTLAEGLGKASAGKTQSTKVDVRAVARNQHATILFYSLGTEKSWLWETDKEKTRLFILPKKADIESALISYQRSILKSDDPLQGNNGQARGLYEALVGPVAAIIPGGSRVIVIPDGSLSQLNFETLLAPSKTHGDSTLHYWIDDVTITNANAIRLLSQGKLQTMAPKQMQGSKKTLLLMGDPVTKGTEFEGLPNASVEINAIEKEFPATERTILTQAAAVPSAYRANQPQQFSYIHFVAHGTASQLRPLDSAVVLSPSIDHPDSYKLYARDIVHQPINAKLVTIAACKGSGTRIYAGEGLVGLSWAFLRAGSHNVIGALWNVDDASTPRLMQQLYSGLRNGSAPDAALRSAKLALLHSAGVYRKPLYWGAFQLYAGS